MSTKNLLNIQGLILTFCVYAHYWIFTFCVYARYLATQLNPKVGKTLPTEQTCCDKEV